MNLKEFIPAMTTSEATANIKRQFGKTLNLADLNLTETIKLLNKTNKLIVETKNSEKIHTSHQSKGYLKAMMVNEAALTHAIELTKGTSMNKHYVSALKIVALGGKLSEAQISSLKVSSKMKAVLESQESSQKFMKKIVESKKAKAALNEGEIADAQTTLAAQDISDQIQTMIAKFADIKYKELPALQDSIRGAQGVDAATTFNSSVTDSLDTLTQSLESAKADVDNAVATLTGQEISTGEDDLDLDGLESSSDEEMDIDLDFDGDAGEDDDSFDMEMEPEMDDEVDLGRARR